MKWRLKKYTFTNEGVKIKDVWTNIDDSEKTAVIEQMKSDFKKNNSITNILLKGKRIGFCYSASNGLDTFAYTIEPEMLQSKEIEFNFSEN